MASRSTRPRDPRYRLEPYGLRNRHAPAEVVDAPAAPVAAPAPLAELDVPLPFPWPTADDAFTAALAITRAVAALPGPSNTPAAPVKLEQEQEQEQEESKKLRTLKVCIICHDALDHQEMGALLCGHTFHLSCVDKWMKKKPECPVCRKRAARSGVRRIYLSEEEVNVEHELQQEKAAHAEALARTSQQVAALTTKYDFMKGRRHQASSTIDRQNVKIQKLKQALKQERAENALLRQEKAERECAIFSIAGDLQALDDQRAPIVLDDDDEGSPAAPEDDDEVEFIGVVERNPTVLRPHTAENVPVVDLTTQGCTCTRCPMVADGELARALKRALDQMADASSTSAQASSSF